MSGGISRISLPDGTPVWARISGVEQPEPVPVPGVPGPAAPPGGFGYADTGFADRAAAQMESLRGLITGVAASVADGLRAARPDEVSVTFGIELTARAGRIVGLLADGEAKGAITVTLTWQGGPPEDLGSGTA
ncbi:CU044_2847 family protein [Streptomyces sp. URMC 129]|uniref:CU044_2847 family protein n=1 Tax=Streptomyces sp. URMC 129 TaxID=3423407 RepID=UPI003F1AD307